MELPVELKALLNSKLMEGKELKWYFSASTERIEVELTWTKTCTEGPEKPASGTGQAKKKRKSPAARKRDAERLNQLKATYDEAVKQREDTESQTDTTEKNNMQTQTETYNSFSLDKLVAVTAIPNQAIQYPDISESQK